MKLTAYIDHLESLYLKHGDLDVETLAVSGRTKAKPPALAYRKILNGRERREGFWSSNMGEEQKGELVARV